MKIKNEWGNPPYESKNPHKHKFPLRWEITWIVDWIIVLAVATGFVLFVVNYFS